MPGRGPRPELLVFRSGVNTAIVSARFPSSHGLKSVPQARRYPCHQFTKTKHFATPVTNCAPSPGPANNPTTSRSHEGGAREEEETGRERKGPEQAVATSSLNAAVCSNLSPSAEGVPTTRGSRRQAVRTDQASAAIAAPAVAIIGRRRCSRESVETDRTGAWRGQRVLPDRPPAARGRW